MSHRRGTAPRQTLRVVGIALVLSALSGGCKTEPCLCGQSARGVDGGLPIDPTLLAFLSRARAAHHLADSFEQASPPALDSAVATLEKLAGGPRPSTSASSPEIREVLADTYARIADLQTRLGKLPAARESIERGLGQVPEISYFRGHLYEVLGVLEEQDQKRRRDQHDEAGAHAAQLRALKALEEAMRIQAEVITQVGPAKAPIPDAAPSPTEPREPPRPSLPQ